MLVILVEKPPQSVGSVGFESAPPLHIDKYMTGYKHLSLSFI